ncbi:MAG: acyl-homoserine-lactone acylase [Thermoleophilaceae bacterium]|nr:acyl-homoserine-lactone acylase [Thermoleophilaceae bacterium]
MRRVLIIAALVLAAFPALAAAASYKAEIRRTANGIPHIEARSYTGVGFGYGYAFAQDNICPIAEDYVTVNGERSRFFGADGDYAQRGNGYGANNLNSDFFYKQIIDAKTIEAQLAKPPPLGPVPEVKQLVRGYVAGYNRYLADVGGSAGVPDRSCRGKPWVRPITQSDAYRRFYQLVLLASQSVAIDGIAEAAPPTPGLPVPIGLDTAKTARELSQRLPLQGIGSNAVAVGRAGTRDHKHGLLLGNPHFPWLGTERFYQSHLRIPGKLDVQGASLFGVPLVLIGHTRTMAWSHTVSTAYRFTPYQLTLVPGSPTTYLYDGQPQQMTSRTMTVQVRQSDGSLKPSTRTLYSTRYGPMLTSLVGVPLPWAPTTAFAMRDANADNFRIFNHFFATDRAKTAPEVLGILKRYEGIPWVNTIVADRGGRALYADIGSIPHVTNEQAQQCNSALGQATFGLLGLPVLDGSRSACEWGSDPDSVVPGRFGPSKLPSLFRTDYVTNSNNSYWLANPKQPLEGFDRIIGDERATRTLRTRIGLIMTQNRVDGRDGNGPAGFTRKDMQNMVFNNRQYAAELVRGDLVEMCRSFGGSAPTSSGGSVPVGRACDVLAAWDRRENLTSRGALLFRRFWENAAANPASPAPGPTPWRNPFDPADPVRTPNGLNTDSPQVRNALGDALNDLAAAKIPIDAPLGDHQFATRLGVRIPIHGGPGGDGDFNAINVRWGGSKGVLEPEHGSSYVQVVTWGRSSCPDARTILTYSQSTNPRSRFYADQTRRFSRKKWVPDLFCRAAVVRGTKTITRVQTGRRARTVKP